MSEEESNVLSYILGDKTPPIPLYVIYLGMVTMVGIVFLLLMSESFENLLGPHCSFVRGMLLLIIFVLGSYALFFWKENKGRKAMSHE